MDAHQKVLFVDAATGFYRVTRYPVGDFFGPVDLGLHLAGRHNSLNIGVGLLRRLDLSRLEPADLHRLLALLGRVLRLLHGRRGPGLRQPGHQHGLPGRQGAVARRSSTSTAPTARRSRSSSCRSICAAVWGGGRGGIYCPDGPRLRAASAAPTRPTRGSWPSGRRRRPPTSARSARCPIIAGKLSPRGHLGRPRRLRQQDAAAARHRRRHLRRHLRRRGLPRPQGGRRVVRGQVPARSSAPRTSRPPSSTASTRSSRPAAPSASTTPPSAGACWPSTTARIYMTEERAAGDLHREVRRRPLPEAVQRGDHRRPSSSTPAASPAPPSARRCGTSSRRTTSPTRPWARCAASSTSAPRSG